ncbi:MAG: glycoside hydrolase family 3 N-terminal domain-containing protein [Verrucomicrobiota bacterium]|nr:glycoside hydrolase family 3 N-terminal domain-containing protein [Verrucomicrobiota bacterium]
MNTITPFLKLSLGYLLVLALPCRLAAALNPAHEVQITALINGMTLDEKLGQIALVAEDVVLPENVTSQFLGGILVGAGRNSHPGLDVAPVASKWADRYDSYKNAALATRLQIPVVVFADAVHGHAEAVGATVIPHNIGLAATDDPELMERLGVLVAQEVAATGVDGIFGPCVATNRDSRWGRTYEGWGDHPDNNIALIRHFIRGVQTPYNATNAVIACAKHFLADGGATWGTGRQSRIDQGDVQVDEPTLRALHLPPYQAAIDEGVGSIMISYGKWNGTELHHHRYLLTDLLKTELGFDGIVMTDFGGFIDSEVPAVDTMEEAAPSSLNAGMDFFMLGDNYANFAPAMKAALTAGTITQARLDDAVRRVLRVKLRHGLFAQSLTDRSLIAGGVFGSEAHRQIAREAAEKSLVLLRNRNQILPLAPKQRVLVAGKKADDMGVQCGGWTVEWAGMSGMESNLVITGTTLLEGIKAVVEPAGGSVTYSADGSAAGDFDCVIVAVGENPTAEWFGDTAEPALPGDDRTLLDALKLRDLPRVVVVFGNRPLTVTERVDYWDALVMAWLPGSEGGAGVANALFGAVAFSGRLPLAWHRNAQQLPIHFEDRGAKPLYPRGFGLSTDGARFVTDKLTPAMRSEPYSYPLESHGMDAPVFSVKEGTLPEGVTMTFSGLIQGTPAVAGNYSIAVEVVGGINGVITTRKQAFTLPVVEANFYERWAKGISWQEPVLSDRDADPDADGLTNQMEFFVASDPLVYSPEKGPSVVALKSGNVRSLILHYNTRKVMALTHYVIESSTDLLQWTILNSTPKVLSQNEFTSQMEVKQSFANTLPFYYRLRLLDE